MSEEEQRTLAEAIRRLMLSDTFGDVHEAVDVLRGLAGLPALEGDYLSGWEEADWIGIDESVT